MTRSAHLTYIQMMVTVVGEMALARKHGGAGSSAPREKSVVCQNGAIKPRGQVQVCMGFRGSGVFGPQEIGFRLNAITRALLRFTSRNLATRARSATMETPTFRYLNEFQGFVEEVRFRAMRLHAVEQAYEPSLEGYLKFLVDSKRVYEIMEGIVTNPSHPSYELFRKTEFVRATRLAKELLWFSSQGHTIPEAGPPGISYANHLMELSQTNVPALLSHLHNVYFGYSAGDQFLVQKGVAGVDEGLASANSETVQRKVKESALERGWKNAIYLDCVRVRGSVGRKWASVRK